jgi:hypothetical protein
MLLRKSPAPQNYLAVVFFHSRVEFRYKIIAIPGDVQILTVVLDLR